MINLAELTDWNEYLKLFARLFAWFPRPLLFRFFSASPSTAQSQREIKWRPFLPLLLR